MYLNRPEYLLQPKFLIRRVFSLLGFGREHRYTSSFGFEFYCLPDDGIAKSIATYGIYDLAIGELIFRLLEPGDTFIDIGANIGYYSILGALAVGNRGKVVAFEPNPVSGAVFQKNAMRLSEKYRYSIIERHTIALSDFDGFAAMTQPADSGLVTINPSLQGETNIRTKRLDSFLESFSNVKVLKLDIEGHELECLNGAKALLKSGTIANVVYEDHLGYPGKVSELLESYGYKIFGIHRGWLGPQLKKPIVAHSTLFEPPNYLATLDPKHAIALTRTTGWKTLKEIG